jgi:subtilisin-like proprotein convertase family protein
MTKLRSNLRPVPAAAVTVAAILVLPATLFALQPTEDQGRGTFGPNMGYSAPELEVAPSLLLYKMGSKRAAQMVELQGLFAEHSRDWEVRWDERNDRPHLIQGVGVPVLPGKGNRLSRERLGLGPFEQLSMLDVEPLLRDFMDRFPELFRIAQEDLALDSSRSVSYGSGQYYWNVEFQQVHNGVPVEGANVFFRINNGNIVQFGNDRISDIRLNTVPKLRRLQAFRTVLRSAGFRASEISERLDRGSLRIVPVMGLEENVAEPVVGRPGRGYRHRLAWQFVFRRSNDVRTYKAWIDAHSGQLLRLVDLNAYAQVTGGIYPVTNTNPEEVRGFGFATLTNGTTKITDAAGMYNYSGGTATVTLNGQFFQMSDNCGAISLSNSTDGNLNFGTSGGTDCVTPGVGGAGNTHASRSGFYHLTRINRKAITFLPGNAWLGSKVTANMNINQTCNAFWNGSTVNFYRSGGGCSNTGEIAAVFLHEWGHGMDTNSGGAANENGSGEAVGDTFAFLETRDGCIGDNFLPGINCGNCTNCTGVRDVSDFDLSGPATIARPSTVTSNTGINCDQWACPYLSQGIFPYQGPMGYEGHCESYIASSANWDLTQFLIAAYGTDPGWAKMDATWYGSLTASKSAYQVAAGGKCNPSATVNGCAATNWYTVYLSVNDDNGNLADGTPDGCRIWDAFDAHGIACGTRPACSGGGPTPTPTPTNTPTNTFTPAPPTNTFTPAPPTNTPTNTPIPPTATPIPTQVPGCNAGSITIPGSGAGSPYPSNVSISGMTGTITKVTVTLKGISHTYPDDLDVLLVGPAGQNAVVMSDVGGSVDVNNLNLTLDDAAALSLPDASALTSGTFKPTNVGTTDSFPAPAPATSGGSALSVFNGTNPNGTWRLYVVDDAAQDLGSMSGGWCVGITTGAPPTNTPIPPTNTPVPPTATPTNTPIPPTATPTFTPGTDLTAVFDATLRAPKCGGVGRSCDSGAALLNGRDGKGPEPNASNTINSSCADGTLGTYHVDESIDRLKVSTTDGTPFAAGKTVRIDATLWVYSSFSSDRLDLYSTADANSPVWTFVGTLTPTGAGVQTLSATYTLPAGSLQAVRAQFRYLGSASTCTSGGYNDRDDLIFAVQ